MSTEVEHSLEVLSQTEQCVVCGDAADGFHYGVRSCRGCNAFFRRAVTFDMQFSCRRGGRCPVDKNARCACRACRLAKCIAVGMDKKAVQPKREAGVSGNNEKAVNGTRFGGLEHMDYDRSPPGTKSPKQELIIGGTSSSAFSPLNMSSTMDKDLFLPSLPPSPPPDSTLITRQYYEYRDQKRRRRAMLCRSLEEILADEHGIHLRTIATPDDYSELFQVQMVLMFEWAEKLPEFRRLEDPMDKTRLLRAFALRYILLDNVFHTMEMGYSDRLILVNNNYVIPYNYPQLDSKYLEDTEHDIMQLMYGHQLAQLLSDLIVPMLQTMKIVPGEMMTLRMIMFWNPGSIGLTSQGLAIAQEASNTAVKELHMYFATEGITDIDARIENLLMLLPRFTTHVKNLYNCVKLIPAFGKMNEWNMFMTDILKDF